MERGVLRFGTVTSNSSEKAADMLGKVRELPIEDIITSIIMRMFNETFNRSAATDG